MTENEAAAAATVAASSSLAAEKSALANFAPVIHAENLTFMVSVHILYKISPQLKVIQTHTTTPYICSCSYSCG